MSQAIALQQSGTFSQRFLPETLLLTAACVWLVNGLHARPEDGPASRSLMEAVLPVTEANDLNQDVLAFNIPLHPARLDRDRSASRRVPFNPYGCVFIRRIQIVSVARMRFGGPALSDPAFKFWFNAESSLEVQARYQDTGIVNRELVRTLRFTSAKCRMPLYINLTGDPEPNLFRLADSGYVLTVPLDDNASDVPDRESEPEDDPQDIDTRLSALWRQFVCDLTSKSPNPRGPTASYLRLNDIERRSGSEDIYKNLRLSDVFRAVHYKNASMKEWMTCFKWLFPAPGQKIIGPVQNYGQCPYYNQWLKILEENRDQKDLIKRMRSELFTRVWRWGWIPFAQVDKMWPTSVKKACHKAFIRWPPAPGRPAPLILLKQNAVPEFGPVDDNDDVETLEVLDDGLEILN